MERIKQHITKRLTQAYIQKFGSVEEDRLAVSLTYPEIQFGDISSNYALQMAKTLKHSPLEIVQTVADVIKPDEVIEKVEIKAPGFINFYLRNDVYLKIAIKALSDWENFYAPDKANNAKNRMVIDYSHPNIGKPMAVHHLLSTIIGDALKLMYRVAGWEVIADSFVGDLGTQFGKLIWAVKQWGDLSQIEKDPVTELQKLYVKFHIEADSDVTLDAAGREEYRKLESGDAQNRDLWQRIVDWSKAEIAPIYEQLGVEFDVQNGESFYEDKINAIIEQGQKKGIFIEDKGALIYRMENPNLPPAILQKSDGASLYLTRDLARIAYWQKQWSPEIMVNVVDVAQALQFTQLFEIADRLRITRARQVHVIFGRMQFRDSAMSTRRGNVLLIKDLLDQAKQKTMELVESHSSQLGQEERKDLAAKLAIASLKYNILRQNRHTNITFDWDTILSLEGSSAPYVAYALSRASSVKERANIITEGNFANLEDQERVMLRDILTIPEILQQANVEFKPNLLLNKLYEVTQKYSHFYNEKRILDASTIELINSRLLLNNLFLEAVMAGFKSLGIELPNKM